jgi:hypothetical protein
MSLMMHRVKKSFHKVTAPRADVLPSAEFLDYQQKLDAVKRNLTLLDSKITETNNTMTRQMIEQRSFSEKFAEGYPVALDETHAIAVEFKNEIGDVYDYFVRQTSPEVASHHRMQNELKAYLKEVAEVELMYRELTDARAETSRYQKKVDAIHTSRKHTDVKKTRNIQKLDAQREKLDRLTASVITAQRRTFAKAPMVHKLALCAFWVSYRTHMQVMMRSLEKTEAFATAHEEEMGNLNIATMQVDIPDDDEDVQVVRTPGPAEVAELTEGVQPIVPGISSTSEQARNQAGAAGAVGGVNLTRTQGAAPAGGLTKAAGTGVMASDDVVKPVAPGNAVPMENDPVVGSASSGEKPPIEGKIPSRTANTGRFSRVKETLVGR